MKIQDLTQELEKTSHYKTFKEQNPETYFAAAFIILDLENKTEQIQLDYFLSKSSQIAAFSFPFTEPKIHDNIISVQQGKTTPSKPSSMIKQTTKIKLDLDDLEKTCDSLIKENNSHIKPTKIIAILKDDLWNLTCMDNMLGVVRIKLNAITGELQDFNKGGLMDFMGIKKK